MSSAIESSVKQLTSMGFPESEARQALSRTGNDVTLAVEYLSNGQLLGDDEFDLIAAAEPEPEVRPPTIFKARTTADGNDDSSAAEFEDSRIASLKEMGFTAAQAESALEACNGDVNEALTLLLTSA